MKKTQSHFMQKEVWKRRILAFLLGAAMIFTSVDIRAFAVGDSLETDGELPVSDGERGTTDGEFPTPVGAANTLSGQGTEADPYLIANEAELALIANDLGKVYKLTADIEITAAWTPIGTYSAPFTGVLDGDGHTIYGALINTGVEVDQVSAASKMGVALIGRNNGKIRNLTVEDVTVSCSDSDSYVGAVAACNVGKIQNVKVVGATYVTGKAYTALLAGVNAADGDIRGCEVTGTVSGTGGTIGGLTAYNAGTIVKCTSAGTTAMNGGANNGGLVGENNGTIEDCESSSSVRSTGSSKNDGHVGGLVGSNGADSVVRSCRASGKVTNDSYNGYGTGGFVGYNAGTVEYGWASGQVEGYSYAGGFCGTNAGSLTYCLARGNVQGANGSSATCSGGFVGSNVETGTIRYCGSRGTVSGDSSSQSVGGFVGLMKNSGTITNCYAKGAVDVKNGGYKEIGGFVGWVYGGSTASVAYCYAAGKLNASKGGGFVGHNEGGILFNSCYYDKDLSEKSDTGNGEPLSTEDMKKQASYIGWNFTRIWDMDSKENEGYPYLRWEDKGYVAVEGVTLSSNSEALNIGETVQLMATVTPDNATVRTVKWKSSKETVATVDANGLVTALRGGTATITATTDRGGYTAECTVTVIAKQYTVKFETDGGTAIPDEQVYEGEPVTRPAVDPVKSGYEFAGWYKDSKFTTEWDFENDTVTGNMTIYAKWVNVKIVSVENCEYTGSEVIPNVRITCAGQDLVQGTDYTVTAENNINAALSTDENPPTAIIKYNGDYRGDERVTFNILPYDVEGNEITVEVVDSAQTGTGAPEVKVSFKDKLLVLDTDYTLEYPYGTGSDTVNVKGKGNFKGTRRVLLKGARISKIEDYEYTGSAIIPQVTITYEGYTLWEGEDYELTVSNNINAASSTDENAPTVWVTYWYGIQGDEKATFNILPYDLSGEKISVQAADISYAEGELKPEVKVSFDGKKLTRDRDYTVAYTNDAEAGTGVAKVTGMGNFTGTREEEYRILLPDSRKKSITGTTVLSPQPQEYTGGEITPAVEVRDGDVVLRQGKDYALEYYNNIKTGKALVIVVGVGNYVGRKSVPFTIVQRDLNDNNVIIDEIPTQTYTGYAITPGVRIKINGNVLEEGVDYTLKYANNKNATSASDPKKKTTVTIKGIGGCKGTRKVGFNISTASFDYRNWDLYIVVSDVAYNKGKPVKCAVEIMDGKYKLKQNRDYTLTFRNNTDIAEAYSKYPPTVTITGKGNYEGASTERNFRIYKEVIGKIRVSRVPVQIYTGYSITPGVSVTAKGKKLYPGRDYSVTYGQNVNVGKGTIYISGIGSYGGVKKVTFTIKPKALTDVPATIEDIGSLEFTGGKLTPHVWVTADWSWLVKGRDYTVTYLNNVNVAGVADRKPPTVIVRGKGNYKGTLKKNFTIAQASLLAEYNPDIKLDVQDAVYNNGNPVKPAVTIMDGGYKLKLNKDYTLSYRNNSERAEEGPVVTITGCGNYLGDTLNVPFRIATFGIASAKVEGITPRAYTGYPITPPVSVMYKGTLLRENLDYRVDYGENIFRGKGYVYIIGMGEYAGTKTVTFNIK